MKGRFRDRHVPCQENTVIEVVIDNIGNVSLLGFLKINQPLVLALGCMRPVVFCFSGKRKSGKDYVCSLLKKRLEGERLNVVIRGVSYPLKEEYARLHNLNANDLKSDGPYKEKFREDMVAWGEDLRSKDPHYFCRFITRNLDSVDILIVSDCRRPTDIEFFQSCFGKNLRLVRVESDLAVRESRGFRFTDGIDNKETECALDSFDQWDFVVVNNEHFSEGSLPLSLRLHFDKICNDIKSILDA